MTFSSVFLCIIVYFLGVIESQSQLQRGDLRTGSSGLFNSGQQGAAHCGLCCSERLGHGSLPRWPNLSTLEECWGTGTSPRSGTSTVVEAVGWSRTPWSLYLDYVSTDGLTRGRVGDVVLSSRFYCLSMLTTAKMPLYYNSASSWKSLLDRGCITVVVGLLSCPWATLTANQLACVCVYSCHLSNTPWWAQKCFASLTTPATLWLLTSWRPHPRMTTER